VNPNDQETPVKLAPWLATAGLVSTFSALAGPSSTAVIDWSSLVVTAPGGFAWQAQGSYAHAFASPDGATTSEAGWAGSLSQPEAAGGVSALASTAPGALNASLTGDWAGGSYDGAYPAQANAWRTGGFTLLDGQTLSASVGYYLAEDSAGLAAGHSWSTEASLWLWKTGPVVFLNTAGATLGAAPAEGTLSVSWTNTTGAAFSGELLASATSYLYVTAVPEPHAGGLLLAGITVLAWLVRRRVAANA
jgi:hypothetical protein